MFDAIDNKELIRMRERLGEPDDGEEVMWWFFANGVDLIDELLAFRKQADSHARDSRAAS